MATKPESTTVAYITVRQRPLRPFRRDLHTELVEEGQETNVERKTFVAALTEVVVGCLLDAPASQWRPLAQAVGGSLDAREAMAWVEDFNTSSLSHPSLYGPQGAFVDEEASDLTIPEPDIAGPPPPEGSAGRPRAARPAPPSPGKPPPSPAGSMTARGCTR